MLKKLKYVFILIGIQILFTGFINPLLIEYNLYSYDTNHELFKQKDTFSIVIVFVIGGIIYPLIEEISFRLVHSDTLIKFKLGIAAMIAFLITSIAKLNVFFAPSLSVFSGIVPIAVITILLLFIINLVEAKSNLFSSIISFSQKPTTVLLSSIFFAIAHIHMIGEINNIFISILVLLPYFLSGVVFSYIKITHNLTYSFLNHSIFNSFIYFLGVIRLITS